MLSLICVSIEWKIEPDLESAARMYRRQILKNADDKPDLVVTLDLYSCEKDREREMLAFYKRPNVDWTSPLTVKLKGMYLLVQSSSACLH